MHTACDDVAQTILPEGAKVAEIWNIYLCFSLSACSCKNWIGSFGCGSAALGTLFALL